ncbi:MAG: CobW family GTP-binding protein, partial [Methyloligellaceae bacterium]
MAPIPVTIVTGFLGAGKSTLVNELLRDPALEGTVVLINEFGEVPIDQDLIAGPNDEPILTTTGCLCCTASSDIKQSLFDLWEKRHDRGFSRFRHVIVETTGLIDPVPVISTLLAKPSVHQAASATQSIYQIILKQFALSRIVTLFDIVNGSNTLDRYPEAQKQVALSDVIVLTKTDLSNDPATQRDIAGDRARISMINPGANILDRREDWPEISSLFLAAATYDLRSKGEEAIVWFDAERIHAEGDHEHGHDNLDVTRHGDDIRSHALILDRPVDPQNFQRFLEEIRNRAGTDLIRI